MKYYIKMDIKTYVRSNNNSKIILLYGNQSSFRCRQRNIKNKNELLKFVSFKNMKRDVIKRKKELIGPLEFNTISKL